ncbi:phosphoribosylaminoimidazolesuccinocarboxamide synthase [bacterium]|nr:phosphoribosylaminoimidazolesuccinocarboxamide synthase [Chloroflexi bacterium CFX6]RIL09132.1 MAG: phosphoribosylaminoimidazolesuccinocarboxamide synthase [bacterium]
MTDAGADALPDDRLVTVDLPLGPKHQGKVRDFWIVGDRRVIVTTDRQSAFDRVLGAVPYKGQVLTRMAAWWFERTRDIVPNHLVAMPDPNVLVVEDARVWPVEMVIRGYITGVTDTALWSSYARGARELYGLRFPDGLRKNQRLPEPVITPTTKAHGGGHDEMITRDEIVARGIVPPDVFAAMEDATRRLFARGQAVAAERGLILVDTKYEFGDVGGTLTLVDEVHTVDSSRYWLAESYAARFAAGAEPETFDKEFLRRWYVDQGYRGEGDPPPLPDALARQMSRLYIAAYERLTGEAFVPAPGPAAERIARNLRAAGLLGQDAA